MQIETAATSAVRSPPPCGEGLGVGVQSLYATPTPTPTLAVLASTLPTRGIITLTEQPGYGSMSVKELTHDYHH